VEEEASITMPYFICRICDCFLPVFSAFLEFEKSHDKYSEQI